MAYGIIAGFAPSTTEPIDSRTIKANATARKGMNSFDIYEGLVVYQLDTNQLWVLIDTANYNNDSGWQLVGSGGIGSVAGILSGSASNTYVSASALNIVTVAGGVTTQTNTSTGVVFGVPVTGSTFTGSFVGNGSGLTGVTATGVAANSVTLGTSTTGDYVSNITAGSGINTTGATTGETISHTISVNSGSMLPYYSSSIFATVSGDITITAAGNAQIAGGSIVNADINNSAAIDYTKINFASSTILSGSITNYLPAGTVSGSSQINGTQITNNTITIAGNATALGGSITAATILSGTGVWSGSAQLPSGIVSASVLSSPAQGRALLTTNGVAGSTIDLGLETGDSPQFVGLTLTGDIAVNGGDITTSATTFNIAAATATTISVGGASATVNVPGNMIVSGDLTVNGNTTVINTSQIYVEDTFILLASGSLGSTDGGIIIDRGSDSNGNIAYGFDTTTDRWGFQNGLSDTSNVLDPTAGSGVNGAFASYVFTQLSHGATKPTTGEFAVVGSSYFDSSGNFWIYTE